MLAKVDMAEPEVLSPQLAKRVKRVLGATPDQRLAAAHLCSGHSEVPEEKTVGTCPPRELPVELLHLLKEGLNEALLLNRARQLCLAWIREYCHGDRVQFDQLRFGGKVNGVPAPDASQGIQSRPQAPSRGFPR